MSRRKPKGSQQDTIQRFGDLPQLSLNLLQNDQLSQSFGIDFVHYKAVPSPIGLKDRGDYRRPDALDTIASNGNIYVKSGCFTATMLDNSKQQSRAEGGFLDMSTSRLVLPRFYNKQDGQSNGDRIYMSPGDRVYIYDPHADTMVANVQKMDYEPNIPNVPMFPAVKVEFLIDSTGKTYNEGIDFILTVEGNIQWLNTGNNPGIDIETKKGRVFSIRYLYKAYWYVVAIPKEVRVTNITTNGVRSPERMPYHVVVQREHVYHNQQKGDNTINTLQTNDTNRTVQAPIENIDNTESDVQVDMSIYDTEE